MPSILWRDYIALGSATLGGSFCPDSVLAMAMAGGELSFSDAMARSDGDVSAIASSYFESVRVPSETDKRVFHLVEALPTENRAKVIAKVFCKLPNELDEMASKMLLSDIANLSQSNVIELCDALEWGSQTANVSKKSTSGLRLATRVILARPDALVSGRKIIRLLSHHAQALADIPEHNELLSLIAKHKLWEDRDQEEDYCLYERADTFSWRADFARLIAFRDPAKAISVVREIADSLADGVGLYDESRPHRILLIYKLLSALADAGKGAIPDSLQLLIRGLAVEVTQWPTEANGFHYPKALAVSLSDIIVQIARTDISFAALIHAEARWHSFMTTDARQRSAVQLQLITAGEQIGISCGFPPTDRRQSDGGWLTYGELIGSLCQPKKICFYVLAHLLWVVPESREEVLRFMPSPGMRNFCFSWIADAEASQHQCRSTTLRLYSIARRSPPGFSRAACLTSILDAFRDQEHYE
ncbi:MAG: hypothetical protein O3B01_32170 [Planctomycetota bacterium]|nr:hypothetical protein [Planctomycetota bacterium]